MEERAKELFFKARKNVFNSNFGLNESPIKGEGLDFREIKEYEAEDLRRINWKASAKSGTLKANVYNETKQMNIIAVLMLSSGLKFGSFRQKIDLAAEVFGLLGFAATASKNLFFPLIFSEEIEKFYEPMSETGEIYEIIKDALDAKLLTKKLDYHKMCDTINHVIKKRAMIFVISDFLDEPDLLDISFHNEVYAICLRDRFEESLSKISDIDVLDTATLDKFELNLDRGSIKKYQELLKAHDEKVMGHFLENRVAHSKIYTDDNALIKLIEMLRR